MKNLRYTKILVNDSLIIHQHDDHIFNMKDATKCDFPTIQILAYHLKGVMTLNRSQFQHYKN